MDTLKNLQQTIDVQNFITKEIGHIIPLDDKHIITDSDIEQIVKICDSDKVFNLLFANLEIFKDRRYNKDDAYYFISKAKKGWVDLSNFTYLIRDASNNIVCAIDIKSRDLTNGEIGYWASELSPGWMTNSVIQLSKLARSAGYQKLFALVRFKNDSSARVVNRAGFIEAESIIKNDIDYRKFELNLI